MIVHSRSTPGGQELNALLSPTSPVEFDIEAQGSVREPDEVNTGSERALQRARRCITLSYGGAVTAWRNSADLRQQVSRHLVLCPRQ